MIPQTTPTASSIAATTAGRLAPASEVPRSPAETDAGSAMGTSGRRSAGPVTAGWDGMKMRDPDGGPAGGIDGVDVAGPDGVPAGGIDGVDVAGPDGAEADGAEADGPDTAGPDGTAGGMWGGVPDGPAGAAVRGPVGVTRGEPACTIVPGASTAVNRDHAPDQPSRVRGHLSSGCDTDSPAGQIP